MTWSGRGTEKVFAWADLSEIRPVDHVEFELIFADRAVNIIADDAEHSEYLKHGFALMVSVAGRVVASPGCRPRAGAAQPLLAGRGQRPARTMPSTTTLTLPLALQMPGYVAPYMLEFEGDEEQMTV